MPFTRHDKRYEFISIRVTSLIGSCALERAFVVLRSNIKLSSSTNAKFHGFPTSTKLSTCTYKVSIKLLIKIYQIKIKPRMKTLILRM